ncbi:MAG: flagellar filament capping protein FliD [Motilibacteraceae bacterium]
MSTSVDGLVSGLNTSQLISQLMQVEAAPQTALKAKVSAAQQAVSSYQSVNSRLSALQTAAEALTAVGGFVAAKGTSSDSSVTVASTSSATPGSLTFHVDAVAAAESGISTGGVADPTAAVWNAGDTITFAGASPGTVTVTGSSLNDVVSSINNAGLSVRASAVKTSDGLYHLSLTAGSTGAASDFTGGSALSLGALGSYQRAVGGSDAVLSIGGTGTGAVGYQVTSSTNTFSDVLQGTSFTVGAAGVTSTVTVATDPGALADKVQAMVTAANAATKEITNQTAWNSATKSGAPLNGDLGVRLIAQSIAGAPGTSSAGGSSLAGLSVDRDGNVTFDRQKFLDLYATDPAKAQSTVQSLATSFTSIATKATDSVTGSITTAINGRNSDIRDLNDQISNWDVRLTQRQQALQLQFSNLEVALGKLKDQGNWLAGQIASLPTG